MIFSRLSLVLRLPLAVILCGQLAFLSGNFSLGDYFVASVEEAVALDEQNDKKFFDAGLAVAAFNDGLTRQAGKVLLGLGSVPKGAILDLHATGPPAV